MAAKTDPLATTAPNIAPDLPFLPIIDHLYSSPLRRRQQVPNQLWVVEGASWCGVCIPLVYLHITRNAVYRYAIEGPSFRLLRS